MIASPSTAAFASDNHAAKASTRRGPACVSGSLSRSCTDRLHRSMYTRASTKAATFPMQKLISTQPTPTDTPNADSARSTSSCATTFTGWTDADDQTKPRPRMKPAYTLLITIGNTPAPHTTARPTECVSTSVVTPSATPAARDGTIDALVTDAMTSRPRVSPFERAARRAAAAGTPKLAKTSAKLKMLSRRAARPYD